MGGTFFGLKILIRAVHELNPRRRELMLESNACAKSDKLVKLFASVLLFYFLCVPTIFAEPAFKQELDSFLASRIPSPSEENPDHVMILSEKKDSDLAVFPRVTVYEFELHLIHSEKWDLLKDFCEFVLGSYPDDPFTQEMARSMDPLKKGEAKPLDVYKKGDFLFELKRFDEAVKSWSLLKSSDKILFELIRDKYAKAENNSMGTS